MTHSIGDGIIVMALTAGFLGYFYLRFLERQRRLDILHEERMAAMEKGIPLPELPIEPPLGRSERPPDPHLPLIIGIVLLAFGAGSMVALRLVPGHVYWSMPLPVGLVGAGLVLYYFLAGRASRDSPERRGQ